MASTGDAARDRYSASNAVAVHSARRVATPATGKGDEEGVGMVALQAGLPRILAIPDRAVQGTNPLGVLMHRYQRTRAG